MKFLHLSDLHLGKTLHQYSLIDCQADMLSQVCRAVEQQKPDAVFISGDIYDRSVPSIEAVRLFDQFLSDLTMQDPAPAVLMISGNHDSGERLRFAGDILKNHHIYIAGRPPASETEKMMCVRFEDEYGPVFVHLLPFVRPGMVRRLIRNAEQDSFGFSAEAYSYTDAVRGVLACADIKMSDRNILLSHQFYTADGFCPETSDSEVRSVGMIDQVDVSCLKAFDYVALGHLHKAQTVGRDVVRYCGSPLKYSVSECGQEKSITVVTLREKGSPLTLQTIPIVPLHDVRTLSGSLQELLAAGRRSPTEDFVSVTVTDEGPVSYPGEQLLEVFPNLLEVKYDNRRIRAMMSGVQEDVLLDGEPDMEEAFAEFYRQMHGCEMSEEEQAFVSAILQNVADGMEGSGQ